MTEPVIASTGEGIAAVGSSFEVHEWSHGLMDGPPMHVHHSDDEAWHVLEGQLRFTFADRTVVAVGGQTVFVPAGIAHTFGNPGPGDVRYLIVSTPRIFALIRALHAPGASADQAAVYRRFDSELVG